MANRASAKRKVIVYVGDGGGTCHEAQEAEYLRETLVAVTAQNYQRATINAIGVLDVKPLTDSVLRALTRSNGGTYTFISR